MTRSAWLWGPLVFSIACGSNDASSSAQPSGGGAGGSVTGGTGGTSSGGSSTGGSNTGGSNTAGASTGGTAGAGGAAGSSSGGSAGATATPIYWGALMDGNDTYGSSYGDAPWDSATWDKFESDAGKKVAIVHWGYGAPPWQRDFDYHLGAQELVRGRGDLSLISLSSDTAKLSDIANGTYDAALTTWVTQAKTWGHPFFLRWDWEMNGSWFDWGTTSSNQNTPSDYVNAWRHFHDLATQAGATNITWVWCVNAEFTGSVPIDQLYPGDDYVDWSGIDGYNHGGTEWIDFSALMTPTYQHLLQIAPSKPIMIAETSSEEAGGSKADWITSALATDLPSSFPRVKALVWFNWKIFEKNVWWPWPIESSTTAQSAFAGGIASTYYVPGGNLGNLPLLSKIAEP